MAGCMKVRVHAVYMARYVKVIGPILHVVYMSGYAKVIGLILYVT